MEKSKLPEVEEKDLQENGETESKNDILIAQLCEGLETYRRDFRATFIGSLAAGMEIGFSFLVVAIVYSFFLDKIDKEIVPYLAAFVYPLGFILVILGKSILFTEQTSLLALPVLGGRKSVGDLSRLWATVIIGNLIGGYLIGSILVLIGPALGVITEKGIIELAEHVSHYNIPVIFGSAMLAGWLMALLSWIITSIDAVIGKITIIYIVTFIIGLAGLHHSIVGNIEAFTGLILSNGISLGVYLKVVVTALLGNAIGGVVFVAVLNYGAFVTSKKMI